MPWDIKLEGYCVGNFQVITLNHKKTSKLRWVQDSRKAYSRQY